MFRIICLLIGYGFGCFQSAYILCRLIGHIDIRTVGSGNAGFTNTTRILGKKVGIAVFIIDILKIILAYIVCSMIFDGDGSFVSGTSLLPGIYVGIGAVLGHNFPCYLGFRGGKGIACTLGLMLCVNWQIAIATYIIGFIIVLIKRYISLASLTMALLYPILMIVTKNIYGFGIEEILLMFVLCVLAYIKHKSNIQRLLNGTENKFGSKKN